jgi:hypothetical protein
VRHAVIEGVKKSKNYGGITTGSHVHRPQIICKGALAKLLISERMDVFLGIWKERRKSEI